MASFSISSLTDRNGHRLELSDHARTRMQQRGIPKKALQTVLQFGEYRRQRDGSTSYYMDKRAMAKAQEALGPEFPQLEKHLNIYLVTASSNTVITIAHQTRSIRRR